MQFLKKFKHDTWFTAVQSRIKKHLDMAQKGNWLLDSEKLAKTMMVMGEDAIPRGFHPSNPEKPRPIVMSTYLAYMMLEMTAEEEFGSDFREIIGKSFASMLNEMNRLMRSAKDLTVMERDLIEELLNFQNAALKHFSNKNSGQNENFRVFILTSLENKKAGVDLCLDILTYLGFNITERDEYWILTIDGSSDVVESAGKLHIYTEIILNKIGHNTIDWSAMKKAISKNI